jgi:hypothetical protein
MREELDKQLCEKYPKIFRDRNAPMNETAMCWGFSCGEGWYNIIDNLCACIQHHIDWAEKRRQWEVEKGVETGEPGYPRTPHVEQVVATQVKEKFGGLRFYYNGGDEQIHGMVRMAEAMAATTCEECGTPGSLRTGGWIRTLCDKHELEHQQRQKERFSE